MASSRNGLSARCPAETLRLRALLIDTAGGGAGGSLALTDSDRRAVYALVAPLPGRFGLVPGHSLVLLRAAEVPPAHAETGLRAIFGLTGAEAQLAVALAAGGTVGALAQAWGLSVHTLRSQLASALGKTGTASQVDLVRLVMTLP